MIQEDKLIAALQPSSAGFIGDDAAVLPVGMAKHPVVTKDLLVEDIHFRVNYFTPQDLAHKALHVNLSDVAAMGATPSYILCGIALPDHLHDYGERFFDSLVCACQKAGVTLIGGDTTASPDRLLISVTAIGFAPSLHLRYRHGAKDGDMVCVIGDLGCAHVGFVGLEQSQGVSPPYTQRFLRPEAKVEEGIWLGKQPLVTSMMDMSDGLYIDLQRLASSAQKHAVLDMDLLSAHLMPEVSLSIAIEGGEDYGLLVTMPQKIWKTYNHAFMGRFGYGMKHIGYITQGEGISFRKGKKTIQWVPRHFTHFGEG